jgi:hypothetical protein
MNSEPKPKTNKAIQVCGVVGAVIGFALMMFLNMATGVVPGGAIGGAIGGGGGWILGCGIGHLLFGQK